jgi:hypothetical protein
MSANLKKSQLAAKLCVAIDELIAFVEEWGPESIEIDDDYTHERLGPELLGEVFDRLEALDRDVCIIASKLGLRLPDWSPSQLSPKERRFGFTGVILMDTVIEGRLYERNQLLPDGTWKSRLLVLKALAEAELDGAAVPSESGKYIHPNEPVPQHGQPLPRWDDQARFLYLGNDEIARYDRNPAPNQTKVLEAFQESGWPHAIDDPLHRTEVDSKKKLRDTVAGLNRKQHRVEFSCTGNGESVRWQIRK